VDQANIPEELKVLVAAEAAPAENLRASLEEMGHRVVGLAGDGTEACRLRQELEPDLVLMAVRLPLMDGAAAAARMTNPRPLPVVLVAEEDDAPLIRRAAQTGVAALVAPPLAPEVLKPALSAAWGHHQRLARLEGVVEELKRSLAERKAIERAKGIVMQRLGLGEKQALARLEQQARRQGVRLCEVAEGVLAIQGVLSR
jgi:response regulator NasT